MNEYNDDYHEWICTDILLFQIHTSDGAVTFTRCTGFVGIEFNEENIVCFDIPNAAALCLLKKCLLSRIIFGEISMGETEKLLAKDFVEGRHYNLDLAWQYRVGTLYNIVE